jgi:hypothetical protein
MNICVVLYLRSDLAIDQSPVPAILNRKTEKGPRSNKKIADSSITTTTIIIVT